MIARDSSLIIRETISGAGLPAPFVDLILIPLSQPGKILCDPADTGWSNLVGAVASAVQAGGAAAAHVAAAVEVLAAALDVLDEIEDGDSSPLVDTAGLPQAINATTALMFLSQQILANLPTDGSVAGDFPAFLSVVARLGIVATGGQYRDLHFSEDDTPSLEQALEISQAKSGSLTACACRLGALLGTIDPETLDLYEQFGRHYGTMLQLSNDLHDAQSESEKSDLARKKPTLPIVYFRRGVDKSAGDDLNAYDVARSGALHFTWVIFERERQKCRRIIEELALKGQNSTSLLSLIH